VEGRGLVCGSLVAASRPVAPPPPPPPDETAVDGASTAAELGTFEVALVADNQSEQAAPSTMYERQPVLHPTGDALKAVKTALAGLITRLDMDDACRQLFQDCLLLFARNSVAQSSAYNDVSTLTNKNCWSVIAKALSVWRPVWQPASGWSRPVEGTCAFKRNAGRLTQRSPWMYRVELGAVHQELETLARPSTRYSRRRRCLPPPLWSASTRRTTPC